MKQLLLAATMLAAMTAKGQWSENSIISTHKFTKDGWVLPSGSIRVDSVATDIICVNTQDSAKSVFVINGYKAVLWLHGFVYYSGLGQKVLRIEVRTDYLDERKQPLPENIRVLTDTKL